LHFFFSSRRRHTRSKRDWSSDVCSSDLMFLPACDGRNILIINSVHIPGNSKQTLESEIGKAMAHDADLEFTLPGQCSSLRASVRSEERRVGNEGTPAARPARGTATRPAR